MLVAKIAHLELDYVSNLTFIKLQFRNYILSNDGGNQDYFVVYSWKENFLKLTLKEVFSAYCLAYEYPALNPL